MMPLPPNVEGSSRSMVAPLLIRPPASWLTCTLLPPDEAPAPDQHIALRQRVNLIIDTFQWCH